MKLKAKKSDSKNQSPKPLKSVVDFQSGDKGQPQIVIRKEWRNPDGSKVIPPENDRFPIVMGVDRARWVVRHMKELEQFVADHS